MNLEQILDAVIRQARHLVFAFDGPIRSVNAGGAADPTTLTAPHIHEALAACRESGRSAAVISTGPPVGIRAYLDAHDLLTQVSVVAASIEQAAIALEVQPSECAVIASSTTDIRAARAAGAPTIGYARTTDAAEHLIRTGAIACVYSMTEVALKLRSLS